MASPFNYRFSSFIVSNFNDNDTDNGSEDDEPSFLDPDSPQYPDMEDDPNSPQYQEPLPDMEDNEPNYLQYPEPLPNMETVDSTVDSDLDDLSSELLAENVSTVDEHESDDTESSTQVESDTEVDEESIEPQSKRMRVEENDQSEDIESVDPNQKCPICLAAWTNVGEHRLCSLRCGHLFGHKCIKQWLTSNNPSAKKCPQCNSRASVRHIRLIYGNKLTCLDTRKVEKMKKQLEESNMKLLKISKALAKQKRKTRKYKQMYRARTLVLTADSDFGFSD